MSQFLVASRYAKSLVEIAQEKNLLDIVKSDMELFLAVCKSSKDFFAVLRSPIISKDKKESIINAFFGSRVNSLTLSIFSITIKKGRENILDLVAQDFINQYNKIKGIEVATIITSVPLTQDLENEFVKMIESITSSKVVLHKKVDQNLIGGFVVKIGDKQIDESILAKLNNLKVQFSKNPYQKAY